MAHSLPRPNPSPEDGIKEGKTKEGSHQSMVSKNVCMTSASRPCPKSASPDRSLSLPGKWRFRCWGEAGWRAGSLSGVEDSFQMTRDEVE